MTNRSGSLRYWRCLLASLMCMCIALNVSAMHVAHPTLMPVVAQSIFSADFENGVGDNLWTITNGATEGNWVRAIPSPYTNQTVLVEISAYDGDRALITGIGNEDLDDGPTIAVSDDILLPMGQDSIMITYQYYIGHRDNASITDTMRVELRRSSDDALLTVLSSDEGGSFTRAAQWLSVSEDLNAYAGETTYLRAYAIDNRSPRSRFEAAIDAVEVTAYSSIVVVGGDTTEIFCATFEDTSSDNIWTSLSSAGDGNWVRGIPQPYTTGGTQMEIPPFMGARDLLTGDGSSEDLDNGTSIARSADISLPAAATEIILDYNWYFSHYTNSSPTDNFSFEIRRASDNALLTSIVDIDGASTSRPATWTSATQDITALAGEQIYLRVSASDLNPQSKVEAAMDEIKILAIEPSIMSTSYPGVVYHDYYNDGVRDSVDEGVAGVTVTAYDTSGVAVETTVTDANGDFALTMLLGSESYRVEFTTFPTGYYEGHVGPDSRTAVQFVRSGSPIDSLELGLIDPYDVCEDMDPYLITPCYVEGEYSGSFSGDVAILKVRQSADGHDFDSNSDYLPGYQGEGLLTHLQVGATYGIAYNNRNNQLYAAAMHKRYVDYGPSGPDAIYQFDLDGNLTGVIELDILTGTSDVAGSDVHDFTPGVGGEVFDLGPGDISFNAVGRRSFGDIELSDDHKTLYVTNLFNRRIYAIDVSSGTPSGATLINSWPAPDATAASRHRPYGLAYHDGRLYVGSVDQNGTAAYVHSSDGLSGSFTLELTVDLTYERQGYYGAADNDPDGDWQPWATNTSITYGINSGEIGYAQPMLSDIEFAQNGDMILGFRDRFGDQTGADKLFRPSDTNTTHAVSQGDILKACKNGSGWIIESGLGGGCSVTGGRPNSGVNNYEFYYWDIFQLYNRTWDPSSSSGAFHWEVTQGGIVQLPGREYIITNAQDPMSDFSGGYIKLDNNTGRRVGTPAVATISSVMGGYTIYDAADFQTSGLPVGGSTAGKANGLGDFEAACDVSITLGNYVWHDEDQDGIQDPGETPLSNVTVEIYKDGVLIGTDVTDALGNYHFGGLDDHGLVADSSLRDGTDYEIRIALSSAQANDGSITDIGGPTIIGGPAQIDNNGVLSSNMLYSTATITTGDYGHNDYSIDFGFSSCVTTRDTISYAGCSGDGYSVDVGGETYDEFNPTGTDTITTPAGCDLIVTIDLYFDPAGTMRDTVSYQGCSGDGYSIVVGGEIYNESNPTGIDTIVSATGCLSITVVDLTFATPVIVEAGMMSDVICSNSVVTLSDLGASIAGGASIGLWTSMGGGTFDNGGNFGGASPATTYTPSALEIAAGEIILTLTSIDPPNPCDPGADAVLILINNVTCAQFPWAGN